MPNQQCFLAHSLNLGPPPQTILPLICTLIIRLKVVALGFTVFLSDLVKGLMVSRTGTLTGLQSENLFVGLWISAFN